MEDGQQLPAVQTEVKRSQFVETFTVRDGKIKHEVAANALASRALMQVNVGRLRAILDRTLKHYEDRPELIPSPKEIKILADGANVIEGLAEDAYSERSGNGRRGNSLERLVFAATAGAAAGSAQKPGESANSPALRLRRLANIGKAKNVTPDAEPPIDLDQ